MPETQLWAVTIRGRVYRLSTNGKQWQEVTNVGMDFKRVSAVARIAWAIGGDHQLYVFVVDSDVPIRIKEVSYENQRWNPRDGFCSLLLPTDRPHFSSQDGLTSRIKESIKLPTLSWQWEDDWNIEDTLDGHYLGSEGWTYAIDFPATYGPEKTWLSCVRRRKWSRYRRFTSCNTWSTVPNIHDDPVQEPFIDISIGGLEIPGGDGDTLAVWSVTVLGRVMFREGVVWNCPEGCRWVNVPVYNGGEINQVSVGPTGLVWAVNWNGDALVRLGVTRNNIYGFAWRTVSPPSNESKLLQVAVGINVVWAITRDGKVWFRKGISGHHSGTGEEWATGSGWVEMVGEMSLISVGPNDQVWALGRDDKNLYFRSGVTSTDLSGKTWKAILLPVLNSSINVNCVLSNSLARDDVSQEPSASQDCVDVLKDNFDRDLQLEDSVDSVEDDGQISTVIPPEDGNVDTAEATDDVCDFVEDGSDGEDESDGDDESDGEDETLTGRPESDNLQRNSSRSSEDDCGYYDDSYLEGSIAWTWVSGGGCVIDEQSPPNWFTSGIVTQASMSSEPWRREIVDLLFKRKSVEMEQFQHIEHAIERVSWTTTGKALLLIKQENRSILWADCSLELERSGLESGLESAALRCNSKWAQLNLDLGRVSCVMCASDRTKPIMAIYYPLLPQLKNPLRIAFFSDVDKDDWIGMVSSACSSLRDIEGRPSNNAIWASTTKGDIFVHEIRADTTDSGTTAAEMFWRQCSGHLEIVECCPAGIVWGLGYNNVAWVYTGGWGGGFVKGMDTSSNEGIYPMYDSRYMYIYENQRWNPLTGFSNRGFPTDRYMWSDRTGRYECTKENTKLPSAHWQWISDWTVDYNTAGGVDKDGWQYARDFPMKYSGSKGFTDYVRRRRWHRKSKYSVSGPWQELNSVALNDVSMQIDDLCGANANIHVWAVSTKGEVLCRRSVSQSCPQGTSWDHVATDYSVRSVSIGGGMRIWVVTTNGTAMLRQGITDKMPTGVQWFIVDAPPKCPLRQVSAGTSSVWAVDVNNGLWFRLEIKPIFPEGTSWQFVCGGVRKVSVGKDDQVWAILDNYDKSSYVMVRRIGITEEDQIGTDWEAGIGGGWSHLCCRGFDPIQC